MVTLLKQEPSYEDIRPLIDLVMLGKLFEVQAWVDAGKPVNLPLVPGQKARRKPPLQVAIQKGFHSLVQVLLEGGARISDGSYNALDHAISERRLDLVQLLVEHGADIEKINMAQVFETWIPSIIEYFIENGADVQTGNPLAAALCWKIRTALGVYKRHRDRFPGFQEQINIALRHHCRKGNLKWVSLLLWAGADPLAKGPDSPDAAPDPKEDICALEYAALYGHFDIFKLKKIKVSPDLAIANELLWNACRAGKADFLNELISQGFNPASQADQGSSLIQTCLVCLQSSWDYWSQREKNLDTDRSRETIKMIHMLARNGAKWKPADRNEINDVRRSLLKMTDDYTAEFIWIMSRYKGCSLENINQLLHTPTIRRLIARHQSRVDELLKDFKSD